MLFNFIETCYKVGCRAIVVEAFVGMVGALQFFSFIGREGHSLKYLHWACLSFFLIKTALFVEIWRLFSMFISFFLLLEVSSWKISCLFEKVSFPFKLAEQDTRSTWICDEPGCEIGHNNFIYCSALWYSLVTLGNWVLDRNDTAIPVQINLC